MLNGQDLLSEVVDCLGKNVYKIKVCPQELYPYILALQKLFYQMFLQNCSTGNTNKKKVNAAVLKPYVPSDEQTQTPVSVAVKGIL